MALDGTIVWEVQTGGDDANGGGYSSDNGGTDYSQQAAAQLSLTDLATSGVGVTTLTSATGGFTSAMVDNLIQIASGTNVTAGFYRITAYTNTNTVTLDRAPDDGVGGVASGVGKVGGALATPGAGATAATVHEQKIYVKAGNYSLSTSTPGAGGPVVLAHEIRLLMEGYQTSRGDLGTAPVIKANAQTGLTLILIQGGYDTAQHLVNINVDGENQASITGINSDSGYYDWCVSCEALACTVAGISGLGLTVVDCLADTCGVGFSSKKSCLIACEAKNCTGYGFDISDTVISSCIHCLARNCGTSSGDGFRAKWGATFVNCTSEGNTTGDGFDAQYETVHFVNCVASNNGGYGFNTQIGMSMQNCAGYNNTSSNWNVTPLSNIGFVVLSADPYTGAGDYRPNNTAGAGAVLRAGGIGVSSQTNNTDIGAVQHADPAGGALSLVNMRRNTLIGR